MILTTKETALFKKFGLTVEKHVYVDGSHYKIITHKGIMQIKERLCIDVTYELVHTDGIYNAVISAEAFFDKRLYSTFGEVSERNNKFEFPIAICEKRALSRLVLDIAGFYEHDFIGQGEIDANIKSGKVEEKRKKLSYDIAANMDNLI